MTVMELARLRVKEGAVLLDRVRPGWHLEINIDRLRMDCCTRCLIGQLWGRYGYGVAALNLTPSVGWKFGFDIDIEVPSHETPPFEALRRAWAEAICERLARDSRHLRATLAEVS